MLSGRAQILVGDMTSHGGVVVSGSATNSWYGRPIARKGDKVTCPKCAPHVFEIAEGVDSMTDTDAQLPMASEGHLTTCGATLNATSASIDVLNLAMYLANGSGFNDRYLFLDAHGQAMADIEYAMRRPDGTVEFGRTDDEGRTHLVLSGNSQTDIAFYLAE